MQERVAMRKLRSVCRWLCLQSREQVLRSAYLGSATNMRIDLGGITDTGACSPASESNDLAANFAHQERYCSAPPVEANCPEAGTCLPNTDDPSFDKTCIFQAGDQECPADYPTKHLRFADLEDTRSCSSCSGPDVGSSCGTVTYGYYDGPQGPSCTQTNVTASGCMAKPAASIAAEYVVPASLPCSASGAELSGEVTETDPTTFCCLPEA